MKSVLLEVPMDEWKMPALMGAIMIVVYFFMIRPQKKKEKELAKLRDEIKNGDTVVTAGGIHGKVMVTSDDSTVIIAVESQAKLKIERASIALINGIGAGVEKK
jgi:preprotein translocase subunit YajC